MCTFAPAPRSISAAAIFALATLFACGNPPQQPDEIVDETPDMATSSAKADMTDPAQPSPDMAEVMVDPAVACSPMPSSIECWDPFTNKYLQLVIQGIDVVKKVCRAVFVNTVVWRTSTMMGAPERSFWVSADMSTASLQLRVGDVRVCRVSK